MGSITDYLETQLLDHTLNGDTYVPVATVYVALATADPTDAATGASMSEVADANAYARTAIAFLAAASRVVDQTGVVTFPQASGGGWGTATHWAIVDNIGYGLGNVLAHGAFGAAKTINDGNTPSIASSEIDVTISANEVSDYLADEWLDFVFRNQAFSSPATWVGLVTAVSDDADTGTSITEVSGGSYGRVQVNVNGGSSPTWDQATGTTPTLVDNTHEIAFPTATANWGTTVGVVICDASTLGNLLFYDNDQTDQDVDDGDTAKYPIGDLDVTLT